MDWIVIIILTISVIGGIIYATLWTLRKILDDYRRKR